MQVVSRRPFRVLNLTVFSWVIIGVQVLFLIWLIGGVGGASGECKGLTGDELDSCEAGTAIGTGIGAAFVLFLWAVVDVILATIWVVTRKRHQ